MKIKTITQYLDNFAPPIYQESYDNAGLLVGDANAECTNVLLCLDTTEAVIEEAIERGCNLVIAHHPIIFGGLKKITGRNYVERTIIKAIKNDIAIYAAHTNLDNVHIGVNKKICDKLGLINCRVLRPKKNMRYQLQVQCPINDAPKIQATLMQAAKTEAGSYINNSFQVLGLNVTQDTDYQGNIQLQATFPLHLKGKIMGSLKTLSTNNKVIDYQLLLLENKDSELGSGMIGTLPTEMKETAFLGFLKKNMATDCIRYTKLLRKKVRKVAVCGGAGGFLLKDAIAQGASIFVTADYKYHEFFDADNKIVIADIGHYESEQFTMELFKELLQKKISNFGCFLSKINTNPIKYL